jgi:hypothetical protein
MQDWSRVASRGKDLTTRPRPRWPGMSAWRRTCPPSSFYQICRVIHTDSRTITYALSAHGHTCAGHSGYQCPVTSASSQPNKLLAVIRKALHFNGVASSNAVATANRNPPTSPTVSFGFSVWSFFRVYLSSEVNRRSTARSAHGNGNRPTGLSLIPSRSAPTNIVAAHSAS